MADVDDKARGVESAPQDGLGRLWRRVAEHRVAQWIVAYVGLAYGIQHAIILTSESYEWPNIVARASMTLLVLGLPIAMTLAWYHGAKVNRRVSGPELTIISLLLVGISMLFYVLVRPEGETARPAVQEASITAARLAAASPKGAISVAVLPFLNLSDDRQQEFFSDGMTEEITAALAKVPDLRVVARTSAFAFKGKNVEIGTIGAQLHATHLIEGSVRKAGNRLRITAQLIRADDGTHIWAEDYDRELTDVFAIQEDIARAITSSLHMTLGLKPGEQLVSNRAIDPESYQQFLRGKAALSAGRVGYSEQLKLLEPVVAKNPNYAPGWAAVAQAYRLAAQFARYTSPEEGRRQQQYYQDKMNVAAHRAVELDPNLVDGKVMLARIQAGPRKIILTEELLTAALALDPNNPDALNYYSGLLVFVGRIKEGLAMIQQVHLLEPYAGLYTGNLAQTLWQDGQTDAAIALWKENIDLRGTGARAGLARIYASQGRYKDAVAVAEEAVSVQSDANPREFFRAFTQVMRTAPAKVPDPEKLPRLSDLNFAYLYVGAPDRALEFFEEPSAPYSDLSLIWHPSYNSVRNTNRAKNIIRQSGLIEYWHERGWPKFCHPVGADDFACE